MIDKETAIELAKEADEDFGNEFGDMSDSVVGIDAIVRLCNLAVAHAQKDSEPVVGTKTWFEDGKVITQNLTASDVYAAEPVAWLYRINGQLRVCQLAEHDDADFPVYTHPAHDDTALLRQALEALRRAASDDQTYLQECDDAITALRERLGEEV